MDEKLGLYVTTENGNITRKLITKKDTVELPTVSIKDELLEFAELDFGSYIDGVRELRAISEAVEYRFGEVDIDKFDELIKKVNIFLEEISAFPIIQALTLTMLEDHIKPDDQSAMFVYETKAEICYCIEELLAFYFALRDILFDYSNNIELDFEDRYAYFSKAEFKQINIFDNGIKTQYHFRSPVQYYHFLLMNFLAEKPNVAQCECCGRYFIPKTKKATKYCDRIIKDGKTCKEIAPKLKHLQSVSKDLVIEIFERTRRKMYKRYERKETFGWELPKSLTRKEYNAWSKQAIKVRDKYLIGELSAEEALKIIEVND